MKPLSGQPLSAILLADLPATQRQFRSATRGHVAAALTALTVLGARQSGSPRLSFFTCPRCFLSSTRLARARTLGRVATRGRGGGAMASASTVASFCSAESRFCHWLRCSDADTVSTPSTRRSPRRARARSRSIGESDWVRATSRLSSTRESVVLTPWPPGPEDLEKRHEDSGTMTEPRINRSPGT